MLGALSQLKAEFLAHVSHELRTPIHAVIGYTELLLDSVYGPLTDEQEETVDFIRESAQDLLSLVNNLLDLSRIESGRADLILESFDVRDLVSEVAAQIKPLADAKHLTLTSVVLTDQTNIRSDRGKLKQILVNLAGNAIKFTDRGKVTIGVAADAKNQPGADSVSSRVAISVQDTGIGIPADQLGRIFEKFYQVDNSIRRQHEGSGLGLYITKQLVDLLSGRVDIQSDSGKGTTVTVSLPANFEEIGGIQRLRSRIAAATSAAAGADSDGKRLVLVVSEQADIARILAAGLGSREYKVRTASDGEEAVSLAIKLRPLVILLDAHASSAQLWSVFQELKTKPETTNIPIIFLSNDPIHGAGVPVTVASAPSPREVLRSVRAAAGAGRKNVLIVDDEESFREVLRCVLGNEGYRLSEAATGREAIARLESEKPDLVLLDLNLPDTDGWGVIQYMTQHPQFKNVEVLIISGLMLDKHETAEIETRQYEYIYKGEFKVDQVLERVADLLEVD
ncbi:MAG TPA: hybrid sensor histidine kinase/response regulator [Verrucomicrobiae bacterium]|nr:hybrid sensor histidine kinase/response regulator [Verrucomicrobiae bacterium]